MNYGLYLSAAGALSSMHRQDVLANNLANMNTVGFKPDVVFARQRLPERIESAGEIGSFVDPKQMLEQLGGGQFIEPTGTSFKQGHLVQTDNDLDLAIEGDGLFVVGDGAGNPRLTRDGRFTLNASGELVMAATGMNVLDVNNRPIRLDRSAPVRFDSDGTINQNGAAVGRLQIIATPDATQLTKLGDNLLAQADGRPLSRRPFDGRVLQRYTESSAVDPIITMTAMMAAAKAAQSNLKMMQYQDQILGQVFNTFAKVT